MNLGEKFQFLLDRFKDGKDFYLNGNKHCFRNGRLYREDFANSTLVTTLAGIEGIILELQKRELFTEEEKAILKLVDSKFHYIVRTREGRLLVTEKAPEFQDGDWNFNKSGAVEDMDLFTKEFLGISSDPLMVINFRDYL